MMTSKHGSDANLKPITVSSAKKLLRSGRLVWADVPAWGYIPISAVRTNETGDIEVRSVSSDTWHKATGSAIGVLK